MNNNNKDEQIHKLEREIWLFEQWLTAIDEQDSDTQKRIKVAYQEIKDLQTTSKENIEILKSGTHNYNAGPDFLNAVLKIDSQHQCIPRLIFVYKFN